jgi:hypothetical protein
MEMRHYQKQSIGEQASELCRGVPVETIEKTLSQMRQYERDGFMGTACSIGRVANQMMDKADTLTGEQIQSLYETAQMALSRLRRIYDPTITTPESIPVRQIRGSPTEGFFEPLLQTADYVDQLIKAFEELSKSDYKDMVKREVLLKGIRQLGWSEIPVAAGPYRDLIDAVERELEFKRNREVIVDSLVAKDKPTETLSDVLAA